jgi:hypothetical protein
MSEKRSGRAAVRISRSRFLSTASGLSLISPRAIWEILECITKHYDQWGTMRITSRMGPDYLQFTSRARPYKSAFNYMAFLVEAVGKRCNL